MSRRAIYIFCLISLAAVAVAATVTAMAGPDPVAAARAPFDALRLSTELARSGRERNDAWSLVVAARMRRLTPVQQVDREAPGKAEGRDPTEAWLSAAESLSGDDPRLAGLIRDVRAIAFKGRSGGPRVSNARLAAGAMHHYGESFQIGHPAVVYVEGDGDTDLILTVRDPAGGAACTQAGPGDVKLCAWTALRGGSYVVEVRNPGRIENAYALATN